MRSPPILPPPQNLERAPMKNVGKDEDNNTVPCCRVGWNDDNGCDGGTGVMATTAVPETLSGTARMIVEAKVGSVTPVVMDNHAVEEAGLTEKIAAMETSVVIGTTVAYPRANNQLLIQRN